MDMQDSKQKKQLDSGETEIYLSTNPHEVYMKINKSALKSFNKEFPNGH